MVTVRLGTLLLCTLFATTALAATDPRQRELKELRGRIDQLKKEIEQAKEDRAEAADSLKQSERRISDVNRALRELDQRQQGLSEELKDIQGNIRQTQRGLDNQQARLAELLRQHQRQGDADALKLLLSGKSPGETARDLEYYRHIGRARAELIRNHQASLDRLDALQRQAEERKDRIEKVKGERLQQRKDLEKEKKARQEVLTSLSQQIQQQRKQVASLVRDEKRLSQLIERLSRLALKPAKTLTAPGRKTSQVPDASLAGLDFAKLKGRLALPVAGTITARFGQAREGGGPSWKGVFIRAPEGQGVRVVASGRVAFADWLRGFGNLLVVDHGDGFLSLYSNNESLYKQVGDSVRAGDVVAAVGNTGGQSEHGLYFELRHQGKPFDPLSWVQ
ncbi:septal ring factor EnvC (AmiA/AmiB activator) [Sulfuritortus calidifontis]|uniref:Septal ring factor EnvC (AmiA/AmiB activator) n=1 Tax=Sulfuritortus calidifontis TaxID=1914471 RepID=A0A4V2UQP9_9PROT|nr:septal ring factor EnvC (AmiA/AmiB activator) [Sulfuritortus calidifontis]